MPFPDGPWGFTPKPKALRLRRMLTGNCLTVDLGGAAESDVRGRRPWSRIWWRVGKIMSRVGFWYGGWSGAVDRGDRIAVAGLVLVKGVVTALESRTYGGAGAKWGPASAWSS